MCSYRVVVAELRDWLGVKNSIWYVINDEYVIVLIKL